jgi:superfamily II DNA or RNA helicase
MFNLISMFSSHQALREQVDRYHKVLNVHLPTDDEYIVGSLSAPERQRCHQAARLQDETRRQWLTCCKTIFAQQQAASLLLLAPGSSSSRPSANSLTTLQRYTQRLPECLAQFGPFTKPSLFNISASRYLGPEAFATEFSNFWKLREETLEKQRLKALRENDADAYMEHLSSLKITSLLRIMEKTHEFMTRLGATLQRKSSADAAPALNVQQTSRDDDEYRRFKEYVASAKDEFKLVHKAEVFVESQPRGLHATLMPHQLVGLRFLVSLHCNNINGILADEMGVGKTIQTLALLLHLKEHMGIRGPHLILAPLSIVREWKDACSSFVGNSLTVAEFVDLPSATKAADYDLVLMAIHRVRAFVPQLKSVRWNFVVVDEAHKAISNLNTITAQSVLQIPYCRRLVLTGTPLNSDLQELWSLLHFLNPDVFIEQESFDTVFRRPFANVTDGGDTVELSEEERGLLVMRMHQVLRPFMLRRTKKDIDSTLRITFHHIRCPLTVVQKQLLRHLRTERRLPHVSDGKVHWRSTLTIESSAQLICNHPFLIPYFTQLLHLKGASEHHANHVALRSSGKFIVLDSILQRAAAIRRKVVIFTHWLDCVDLLTEYFDYRGWEKAYVVLTGATSADERRENVDRFRSDPDCWIFLVTVKAGGCGINLQVAHLVLVLDKDYTGTNEDQAIARVLRIGQRNTVRALFLLTDDPSESRVAHIADRKDKPRKAIIEGGAYNTKSALGAADQPEDDDETRAMRLIAQSEAYGSADSTIDCIALLDVEPPLSPPHDDSSLSSSRSLLGIFDALIANETGGGEVELSSAPFEHVQGAFSAGLCDETIREGWQLLEQPEEECGRGKRDREEVNLLMPTEGFWDKYAEQDMGDEEIIELYRKQLADKERRKAARLEEIAKAKGFADTDFPEKAKLKWVSLRRRATRKLIAAAALPSAADGEVGEESSSSE